MVKKITAMVLIMLIISSLMGFGVSADMGPKPSVSIEFPNTDGNFYVTLLSKHDTTGPYSHDSLEYYRKESEKNGDETLTAFDKIAAYNDKDGFYFVGHMERCDSENGFSWGYYPPYTFKILVYFPATDSFAVSEIMDRYAFDSYYTATVSGGEVTTEKNYAYFPEILEMLARILITLLIELLIALPFGFFAGKRRNVVIITNVITQVLLNVSLNVISYSGGWMVQMFAYFLIELAVFVIEGIVYTVMFKKDGQPAPRAWKTWLYSLTANAASFVIGMLLLKAFLE